MREGRTTVYGHALFGVAHISFNKAKLTEVLGILGQQPSGFSSNSFAAAFGGGIDVRLSRTVSLRAIQADYVLTHFRDLADGGRHNQNNIRVSTGVVFRLVPVEQGSVLYLGLEDGLRRLKRRLSVILGSGTVPGGLHFKIKWKRLDEGGTADLEKWMTAHPDTRLIVIDTLKKVRPLEKRGARIYDLDYEAIQWLQEFAGKYSVSVLIVVHTNKRGAKDLEDPFDSISGSLGLTGASDSILLLKRERGRHDAVLLITGRDIEERELSLRIDQGIGSWTLLGDADEYRLSESRAAILKVLRGSFEPMTPADIGKALDLVNTTEDIDKALDSLRHTLRKMVKDGQVSNDSYGKYTVAVHSAHSVHPGHSAHAISDEADVKDGDSSPSFL
jgi:hypothetical protein